MDVKALIRDRLSRIEDLEQRKILKDLMSNVFLEVFEHNNQVHQQLQERIFEEIEANQEDIALFATICERDQYDPLHPFLSPMRKEDVEPYRFDITEMIQQLIDNKSTNLITIFLECDYLLLKELVQSDRTFKGKIITTKAEHEVIVRLKQNQYYPKQVENLYEIFLRNDVPWKTVFHPYIYKFFDVMLENVATFTLGKDEQVEEITLSLEEFEQYKKTDVVPLWNIKNLEVQDVSFTVPAADRVNYEHKIPLEKLGLEHSYFVNSNQDLNAYVKRLKNQIVVISSTERNKKWNLLQISKAVEDKIEFRAYELVSNQRNVVFLDSYARKYNKTIRSTAEVSRLVNSYMGSEQFKLVNIAVESRKSAKMKEETYPLNNFIHDYVRDEEAKHFMIMTFEFEGAHSFTTRDQLSFLVAEVQLHFPEYECVGVLR